MAALGIPTLAPFTGSACPGPVLTPSGLLFRLSGTHGAPACLCPGLGGANTIPSRRPRGITPALPPPPPRPFYPSRELLGVGPPCAQACPAPSPPPTRARVPASPAGGLARSQAGPAPGTGTGPSRAVAPALRRRSVRLADRSCVRNRAAPPRSTREGEYAAAVRGGPRGGAGRGGEPRGPRPPDPSRRRASRRGSGPARGRSAGRGGAATALRSCFPGSVSLDQIFAGSRILSAPLE